MKNKSYFLNSHKITVIKKWGCKITHLLLETLLGVLIVGLFYSMHAVM